MSGRPWGKQHAPMLHHSKYIRASIDARAGWHTLFLYALNQPGEGQLGTPEDVATVLRMYGHPDPEATVAELRKLRLVDERRGVLFMHDWADHQPKDPTGRDRKAAQRDRDRGRGGGSGDDAGDEPQADAPPVHPVAAALTTDDDVYALVKWVEQHTRRVWPARPGQRAVEVLVDLVKAHGRAAVETAFETVTATERCLRPEQIVFPAQRLLEPIPNGSPKRRGPASDMPAGQSYDDLVH